MEPEGTTLQNDVEMELRPMNSHESARKSGIFHVSLDYHCENFSQVNHEFQRLKDENIALKTLIDGLQSDMHIMKYLNVSVNDRAIRKREKRYLLLANIPGFFDELLRAPWCLIWIYFQLTTGHIPRWGYLGRGLATWFNFGLFTWLISDHITTTALVGIVTYGFLNGFLQIYSQYRYSTNRERRKLRIRLSNVMGTSMHSDVNFAIGHWIIPLFCFLMAFTGSLLHHFLSKDFYELVCNETYNRENSDICFEDRCCRVLEIKNDYFIMLAFISANIFAVWRLVKWINVFFAKYQAHKISSEFWSSRQEKLSEEQHFRQWTRAAAEVLDLDHNEPKSV